MPRRPGVRRRRRRRRRAQGGRHGAGGGFQRRRPRPRRALRTVRHQDHARYRDPRRDRGYIGELPGICRVDGEGPGRDRGDGDGPDPGAEGYPHQHFARHGAGGRPRPLRRHRIVRGGDRVHAPQGCVQKRGNHAAEPGQAPAHVVSFAEGDAGRRLHHGVGRSQELPQAHRGRGALERDRRVVLR